MSELTDEQLRSIYAWIDAIPLSRPKRNISRDFSDGCMLAEVVAAYFPELVELHNYSAANSIQQKIYNFETLNQRVLRKFDYQLPRSTIDDLVNCKPGVVESVLNTLQYKMAKYREKKKKVKNSSIQSPPDTPESPSPAVAVVAREEVYAPTPSSQEQKKNPEKKQIKGKQKPTPNVSVQVSVDEEILLEKEEQIKELQETVEILELKIAKLEQLVRLKDNKIQKLLSQK